MQKSYMKLQAETSRLKYAENEGPYQQVYLYKACVGHHGLRRDLRVQISRCICTKLVWAIMACEEI